MEEEENTSVSEEVLSFSSSKINIYDVIEVWNGSYWMKQVLENVAIFYKDGIKELFDAAKITEKGVYTGVIKNISLSKKKFVDDRFIPINQIQEIKFLDENDKLKDIDFKKM